MEGERLGYTAVGENQAEGRGRDSHQGMVWLGLGLWERPGDTIIMTSQEGLEEGKRQ